MPIRTFRDIRAYQASRTLTTEAYKLGALLPPGERHGLSAQLTRAAVSVRLNIAKGYGRRASNADFRRCLRVARGSLIEVVAIAETIADRGFAEKTATDSVARAASHTDRLLFALIKAISVKKD